MNQEKKEYYKKMLKPTPLKIGFFVFNILISVFVYKFPLPILQFAPPLPLEAVLAIALLWLAFAYAASCGIVVWVIDIISKKRSERFPASLKREQ